MAVTFSRGGYAGGAVAVALVAASALWRSSAARRPATTTGHEKLPDTLSKAATSRPTSTSSIGLALMVTVLLATVVAVAWPIITGPFAAKRLSGQQVTADLAVRTAHWQRVQQELTADIATAWWGHGLGQYPAQSLWRSLASRMDQAGAAEHSPFAVHRFSQVGGDAMLQIGAGPRLYVDQIVELDQSGPRSATQTLVLRLSLKMQAQVGAPPQIGLALPLFRSRCAASG